MKKVLLSALILTVSSLSTLTFAEENEPVQSLRGANDIASDSNKSENKKWVNNDQILDRQYVQQPPLIPHSIDNYHITVKANKCLSCHSWKAAKQSGATKISLTHFKNREGTELSNVSAGRFFCTQCHVPQKNAQPLIENQYQPVDALSSSD